MIIRIFVVICLKYLPAVKLFLKNIKKRCDKIMCTFLDIRQYIFNEIEIT